MTKKNKKDLEYVLRGIILLPGLWIIFEFSLSWHYLLGLLVVVLLVPVLILRMIPDKTTKRKKSTNNTTTSKKTTTTKLKTTSKEHNLLRSETEILTLPFEELSWREFERLCFLYYKAKGCKPKETSEGADGGVDLIIFSKEHNANVAVQIKLRTTGKQITVREIRELRTAKSNHNCALADFITTSSFTNAALLQADKFNINTYGREWVENKLLKWRDQEAAKRNLA